MSEDVPKPILIPMPVLPMSGSGDTSSTSRKKATKKRRVKKKAVKKRVAGGLEATIRDVASSQGKIQAIKLYRERTGTGLREAKEAVEAIIG